MTAKDLKNALLQEAVQGKLVPQIASEGNAKDLLEKIRKEKAKLVKEGKIKKENTITEITEEDIPFEIPESWSWCKLGEICNEIKRGKSPKYVEKSNYLAFAQKCNVKTGGIDLSLAQYIDENSIGRYSEADNLIQNDIVINSTGGGTMGRVGLYETKVPAGIKGVYPDSHVTVIRSIGNVVQRYLYYILKLNQPILEKCGTGSTNQTELKPGVLANFVVPLPPLAEQKRIVAAIEKFMPFIDEYGKKEAELKAFNEQIGSLTKKAILQEAVQGKLVPQIASEGNAKDLLEEIKKEKAKLIKEGKFKKEKPLPEITEDEIPFDIPESWCWCRLGEIGDWKAGSTPSRSNPELYNGNIPWLKTGDLTDGDINEIPECISKKALESCSMRLNPIGSVLIAMYGATIGKLGILKIEATTNQACCACVPYNGIYNKYLFYYLMSQKKDFTEKAEGGAQPNISREKLVVHLLPLPPYEEQKCIVAAIEKLLPLCEKLGEK